MLVRGALLRRARLKITLEVLQQCHLLLELLGELVELILGQHILLLVRADSLSLIVVKATALCLCYDLSAVVEKDAC